MVPLRKNRSPVPPPDCALAACLHFLGQAWAPQIIWYLGAGARRFGELRHDLRGVSAKVLTTRLRELEREGLVSRRLCPSSPPTVEYSLTELGRELLPALAAIVEVGHRLKRRARGEAA